MPDQNISPTKRCSKCSSIKAIEDFTKDKGIKDGHSSICRVCDNASRVERDRKNPEKKKARQLRYSQSEKGKASVQRYVDKDRSNGNKSQKESTRRYRQTESYKITQARYRNSEKGILSGRAISLNYQAKKRGAEGHYTVSDVQSQLKHQKGRCYYCGEKVGMKFHVDHVVPLSRGGSNWPDNIVVSCPTCNVKKFDRLPHEWPDGGKLL